MTATPATLTVEQPHPMPGTPARISDEDQVAIVHHSKIVAAPWGNVRKSSRSPAAFDELKRDIVARGIIQSVTVRRHPVEPDLFELLAGYGRWEGAVEADCLVPILIKNVNDVEAMAIGLAENIHREDMNPVDEANAAKMALTVCKGDYEEAALALNWTVVQLKKRLNLTRCSALVQAALVAPAEGEFKLSLRHADLLAGISEEAQDKLLAEIINKKLAVADLKALLGKASTPLSSADFDISGCAGCPHNTQQQHFLFDDFADAQEALCRNLVCFKSKHHDHIEKLKIETEERYGKVILLSEVTQTAMPFVSDDEVGKDQFTQCLFCANRVALLDDRLGKGGTVKESRCADLSCFSQCAAKYRAASAPAEDVLTGSSKTAQIEGNCKSSAALLKATPGAATSQGKSKPVTGASATPQSAAVPSRIVEDNKAVLRQAAVAAWGSTQESAQLFQTAMILAALKSLGGKAFNIELPRLLKQDINQIRSEILSTVNSIASDLHVTTGCSVVGDIMINTLPMAPEPQKHIVAAWMPTKERLGLYTKEMLEHMLNDSGFGVAYVAEKGEKGFKDLMAMTRADRVNAIMAFGFDWSSYAPALLMQGR